MGSAAYNRGSRIGVLAADALMPEAQARADRRAHADEVLALRERVRLLERDLSRARRCLAALRYSHDARMVEARADAHTSALAISCLCRIAFPRDADPTR